MRKANQPDERQVCFRFLNEAERDRDRALAGRRALTAAKNKSLLRGGLEGMKFPMMMWLGYMIGLATGRLQKLWAWTVNTECVQVSCSLNKMYLQELRMLWKSVHYPCAAWFANLHS
jgi:hypothetical protein